LQRPHCLWKARFQIHREIFGTKAHLLRHRQVYGKNESNLERLGLPHSPSNLINVFQ
jgi:hypothetical protein